MSVATEILSKDDKPKAGELICALAQAGSLSQMGGKAWHLSAMLHEGFPIIPGFVVPNVAFQEFLDFNQLRQPIAAFVEQIDRQDPARSRIGARDPGVLGIVLVRSILVLSTWPRYCSGRDGSSDSGAGGVRSFRSHVHGQPGRVRLDRIGKSNGR